MPKSDVDWNRRHEETEAVSRRLETIMKDYQRENDRIFDVTWFYLRYPPEFHVVIQFYGLNKLSDHCLNMLTGIATTIAKEGLSKHKRTIVGTEVTFRFFFPYDQFRIREE